MNAKFIVKTQESMIPEQRRKVERDPNVKIPKKRGRKKSHINLGYFLHTRKVKLLHRKRNLSREGFLAGLGVRKKPNFFYPPWEKMTLKSIAANQTFQHKLEEKSRRKNLVTTVPVLTAEEILARNFEWRKVKKRETFFIPADERYGEYLFYFGMVMPDNCMVNDGICKGDLIAAVSNLRPGYGDLVVCRLPFTDHLTVRRFYVTASPVMHVIYEGGNVNPISIFEDEHLVYGVVVNIQRSVAATRLPALRPENLLERMPIVSEEDVSAENDEHFTYTQAGTIELKDDREKEKIAELGAVDWEIMNKARLVFRRHLIKADGWKKIKPFKRKGKKRGPKKHARLRAAAAAQRVVDVAKAYKDYKKEAGKYGL